MKLSTVACALVAAFAVVPVLAGCGGEQGGSAATGPGQTQVFNDTDVAFAQQMVVHHRQGIAMADVAKTHAQDPQVKNLADEIAAEQQPQVQTLTGWLEAWGRPVPSAMSTTMPHMPTTGATPAMPTMPPQPDMSPMMEMHGAQFDRMFLQMMITHHQGAVAMAQAEQASGANPAARQLASSIESSQTAQISQMQGMLAAPSPTHS